MSRVYQNRSFLLSQNQDMCHNIIGFSVPYEIAADWE